MNKMTQLELGEAEIETGLSEPTARSPHAVSLPSHVFSLCILSSKQGPPLFLKPGLDSSALRWWRRLFCCVSCLCGASMSTFGASDPLSRWLGPSSGWSRSGAWVASAAEPSWGGSGSVCSLSEFDTLQPGKVPGVSKRAQGSLLLFSIHTAAAFITVPWTRSPSVVSQPSLLRCQGEMKLACLCNQ